MRRFEIVGLLALVLAVCGLAASSAFAVEPPAPYWAECVKTSPKRTGHYAEGKCAKLSASGTGNYELKAGIGQGGGFAGKINQVTPHLEMQTASGLIVVECKKGTDTGRYGLPNRLFDVVFTYDKCHGAGALSAQKCTSPGASEGTIQLSPLGGEMGYTFIERLAAGIGLLLENEADPGGLITQFSCGTELDVRISGQQVVDTGGPKQTEATKYLGLSDVEPKPRLGEQEYNGKKYTPLTNLLGWESELREIELGERPPHVLVDELCGAYIQTLEGEACTPPLYMGVGYIFTAKGEPLRIVGSEGEEG